LATTLLTRMTVNSLHIQWSLTSQSHCSFLKESNRFFEYLCTDQTPRPPQSFYSLREKLFCEESFLTMKPFFHSAKKLFFTVQRNFFSQCKETFFSQCKETFFHSAKKLFSQCKETFFHSAKKLFFTVQRNFFSQCKETFFHSAKKLFSQCKETFFTVQRNFFHSARKVFWRQKKIRRKSFQLNSETLFSTASTMPGLPDGIFSNQKIQIWVNFGGSCSERCWYVYYIAIT
jgi:hypothetical protein